MRISRKVNLMLILTLCAVCISMLHPMTVCAAGGSVGGPNNQATVSATIYYDFKGNYVQNESWTYVAKDDYEIVGVLYEDHIAIWWVKSGKSGSLSDKHLSDYVGYKSVYDIDSSKYDSLESFQYGDGRTFANNIYFKVAGQYGSYSVKGMKLFADVQSAVNYAENGSLDGMINEDDVDSGTYDSEIGYLHDLKRQGMMYGEQDENGFYESFEDRYIWSDYYPEYDDSYLVEVRASCEVEVKKWFGLGSSIEYKSDVRLLDTGVPYKDLEYILSLEHEKQVFSDFINEYMPDTGVTVGSWWLDTLYFRIYRWDAETDSFKYGKWVRLQRQGSALSPTQDFVTDYGEINKDGNWKQDSDSDYGKGKKGQSVVGSGADQESAKNEVNKKQEEQDNGGKQIDLSNTNFAELWEWFTGVLLSFWNGLGVIPDFFARLFSFLPSPVIGFIGLGIVVAIILRVLGR